MFKQNDYLLMIGIVIIATVASFVLVSSLVEAPEQRSTPVPQVAPIDSELPPADPTVFTEDAINPTLEINIGDSGTEEPFRETQDSEF